MSLRGGRTLGWDWWRPARWHCGLHSTPGYRCSTRTDADGQAEKDQIRTFGACRVDAPRGRAQHIPSKTMLKISHAIPSFPPTTGLMNEVLFEAAITLPLYHSRASTENCTHRHSRFYLLRLYRPSAATRQSSALSLTIQFQHGSSRNAFHLRRTTGHA